MKRKYELADDAERPTHKLDSAGEALVAWAAAGWPDTRDEFRHEPDHHQQFLRRRTHTTTPRRLTSHSQNSCVQHLGSVSASPLQWLNAWNTRSFG